MNIKLSFLLIFIISVSFAQDSALFDRTFHHRTDDTKSINKREYFVKDSIVEIKDYKNNKLFRTGTFYGFTDLENLDEYIWYNSNYQYDRSPDLITKNRKGEVKYLNKNGNITLEQLYTDGEVKFVQLWSKGKPFLTNGNGKFERYLEKEKEHYTRVFKDSLEVQSYFVRELTNDTIFHKTDTKAYPKKGLKHFYKDLADTVDYPAFSKFMGIDKKITITFVVDKNGNLTDFKPHKNKSLNFEKKAIQRLSKIPKWTPATINGKNVKTRFTIPLTFQSN